MLTTHQQLVIKMMKRNEMNDRCFAERLGYLDKSAITKARNGDQILNRQAQLLMMLPDADIRMAKAKLSKEIDKIKDANGGG